MARDYYRAGAGAGAELLGPKSAGSEVWLNFEMRDDETGPRGPRRDGAKAKRDLPSLNSQTIHKEVQRELNLTSLLWGL